MAVTDPALITEARNLIAALIAIINQIERDGLPSEDAARCPQPVDALRAWDPGWSR